MLRKLVINDWVHVSSGIVFEDRGWMVNWHVPVWEDFCWVEVSNADKCHRKKNFFINDSVGLSMSMCDCPVET